MKKKYISKNSQTDWEKINKMENKDIDFFEIPETKEEQFTKFQLRIEGKAVPKGKVRVNVLLDAPVVAYFKSQAGGRGYQTLINQALKTNILHDDPEKLFAV